MLGKGWRQCANLVFALISACEGCGPGFYPSVGGFVVADSHLRIATTWPEIADFKEGVTYGEVPLHHLCRNPKP